MRPHFEYAVQFWFPVGWFYTLSGRIGKLSASYADAEGCRVDPGSGCTDLYNEPGAQGVLPMKEGGTTSQLDLPNFRPLSVAGCGRLQAGDPHWVTSVDYCK